MLNLMHGIFRLSRSKKRIIQVTFDTFAILACFWLAMALRLDGNVMAFSTKPFLVLIPVTPITIIAFISLGLYRAVIRFMADRAVRTVAIGVLVSALTMFVFSQALTLNVPRSVPGIYFALLLITVGGSRFLMRGLHLRHGQSAREPVLIYGAREEGRMTLQALEDNERLRPILFVDDDDKLAGTEIRGIRVIKIDQLPTKLPVLGVKTAILTSTDQSSSNRRDVAKMLTELGLEVRTVPNITDLISGRVSVSDLRKITVEELLGRDPVKPLPNLLTKTIKNRSIMVTGAGGSIGSELCRQIIEQRPKILVLFENSEFSLYRILEELNDFAAASDERPQIVPVLGSVTNRLLLTNTITSHSIDTIFHAAAYKHVPLVEENVIEGLKNNVVGTRILAEVAGRLKVENFTLISSDKAVRPTNVMGATKRISEIIIQANAVEYNNTKYCAVRFGNVLGSSGSVIPKFSEQIKNGGPITVTHTEITRYFMTIPEAAQLVIQASAMAECGEIFLLDMGDPIKIIDLAKTMVRLQGFDPYIVGDETPRPKGLPIEITGLRPGEKLYEELLVDERSTSTQHPRIMVEDPEHYKNANNALSEIADLEEAIASMDASLAIQILKKMPIEFNSPPPNVSKI
ncbi:polysaccharide biosynthesis protein [Rhodobacterales bacterium LSUCC0387]|nr:polysaccharide biosynthesis protein [Rhodobacterales bacterium LSUCC0387]